MSGATAPPTRSASCGPATAGSWSVASSRSLSFGDLAARTGHPSADAARKATARALGRLRRQLAE